MPIAAELQSVARLPFNRSRGKGLGDGGRQTSLELSRDSTCESSWPTVKWNGSLRSPSRRQMDQSLDWRSLSSWPVRNAAGGLTNSQRVKHP